MQFITAVRDVMGVKLNDGKKVDFLQWHTIDSAIKKEILMFISTSDQAASIFKNYPAIHADNKTMAPQRAPFGLDVDPEYAVIESREDFQAVLAACITETGVPDMTRRALLLKRNNVYDAAGRVVESKWVPMQNAGNISFTAPAEATQITEEYRKALAEDGFVLNEGQLFSSDTVVTYRTSTNDDLPYPMVSSFQLERSREQGTVRVGSQLIGGIPIRPETKHKPEDSGAVTAQKRKQIALDQLSHKIGVMLHELMPIQIQVAVLRLTASRLKALQLNDYNAMGQAERELLTVPTDTFPKIDSAAYKALPASCKAIVDARMRLMNPTEPYLYADLVQVINDQRLVRSFNFKDDVMQVIEEASLFCDITQSINVDSLTPIAEAASDYMFLFRTLPNPAVLEKLQHLLTADAYEKVRQAAAIPGAMTYGAVEALSLNISDSFSYHLVFAEFPSLFKAMIQFRGTELSVKVRSNIDSLQYDQSFFTHEFPVRLTELYQGLVGRHDPAQTEQNEAILIRIVCAAARASMYQILKMLENDRFNTLPFHKVLSEKTDLEQRLGTIKGNVIFLWKDYVSMYLSTQPAEAARLHLPEQFLEKMDMAMEALWAKLKVNAEAVVLRKFPSPVVAAGMFAPIPAPVVVAAAVAAVAAPRRRGLQNQLQNRLR